MAKRKLNYPARIMLSPCIKDLIESIIVTRSIDFQTMLKHPFVDSDQDQFKNYIEFDRKQQIETAKLRDKFATETMKLVSKKAKKIKEGFEA